MNRATSDVGAELVSVAKRSLAFKIAGFSRLLLKHFLDMSVCLWTHVGMKHIDSESASDVMRWLQSEAAVLWPALLGSLSLRRSRCVRANCAACLSGDQHQSYVLYDRAEGRRIAVYVPEELVPQVQRGLDNGRCCTKRHRDTSKRSSESAPKRRRPTRAERCRG